VTTNAQPARFFITYRHADAEEYAQRLYGSLALHYSDDNVFLDILSIEPGLDFTKRVDNAISECDVLLFLVGSDFLATSGSQGQGAKGRGKEALDYVHTELRAALDRGVRVVPVLVEEAGFPPRDYWPKDLVSMSKRHAFRIRDQYWDADVERLLEVLGKGPVERQPTSYIDYQERKNEDIISDQNAFGVTRRFGRPQLEIREAARLLAQWFRGKGLLAQVLYRPNSVVVQCTDQQLWRTVTASPLVLSAIMTEDEGLLEVDFSAGKWVDQSIPEGVTSKARLEVPDPVKRFGFVAAGFLLFNPAVAVPTISTGIGAAYMVGKRRKWLAEAAGDFLTEVLYSDP
jgi:hypothetical protein